MKKIEENNKANFFNKKRLMLNDEIRKENKQKKSTSTNITFQTHDLS
jgi:hypothetical protein